MNQTSSKSGEPAPRPRLGVVVPMANCQDTVDNFIERVMAQLDSGDVMFCVVDTVSHDGTKDSIARHAKSDSRVKLVWAPECRSVVDAYFRGYREALQKRCEWILEMDAALSHCPEEIPRFLEAMSRGNDFAAGSRFVAGGSHRGSFARYSLSRGGSILVNFLLGTHLKDMTSGFQCFTERAMQHVVENGVKSRAHFFQTEVRYMLRDWKQEEVPISYRNPSKSVRWGVVLESLRNLRDLHRHSRNGHSEEKTIR